MKIIGTGSAAQFIVSASKEELCKVMGFGGSYGLKDAELPAIGKEIMVSELYDALSVSRTRKAEISKLADDLRRVAGRVDTINQALASPIIEVKS